MAVEDSVNQTDSKSRKSCSHINRLIPMKEEFYSGLERSGILKGEYKIFLKEFKDIEWITTKGCLKGLNLADASPVFDAL